MCGLGRALCADGQESDGRNLLLVGEKLAAQLGDQMVLGKAQDALKVVTGTETTPRLTKRETDVIRLVDRGESDRAIADHLGIAVPTVRRHLEISSRNWIREAGARPPPSGATCPDPALTARPR
jgi:hypothetical protein